MNYSSALYRRGDETLEEAQEAKLDHVIELLEIAGGERVLEIGCGWGELAERLVVTSRFNSRCGPSDCSAALAAFVTRPQLCCPAEPLVSYQINRQLSG
jgi:cyclopropane fatty-acyl-phospholipid synthase-like methyltransferase